MCSFHKAYHLLPPNKLSQNTLQENSSLLHVQLLKIANKEGREGGRKLAYLGFCSVTMTNVCCVVRYCVPRGHYRGLLDAKRPDFTDEDMKSEWKMRLIR